MVRTTKAKRFGIARKRKRTSMRCSPCEHEHIMMPSDVTMSIQTQALLQGFTRRVSKCFYVVACTHQPRNLGRRRLKVRSSLSTRSSRSARLLTAGNAHIMLIAHAPTTKYLVRFRCLELDIGFTIPQYRSKAITCKKREWRSRRNLCGTFCHSSHVMSDLALVWYGRAR